jgi:hypothetical protein
MILCQFNPFRILMESVSSSETLANIYQTTWCYIPEDSHLHTCCCENLNSHGENPYFNYPKKYKKLEMNSSLCLVTVSSNCGIQIMLLVLKLYRMMDMNNFLQQKTPSTT